MSLDDLIQGLCELDEAYAQYDLAQEYVSGEVPEVFSSARIQRLVEVTGQKYKFGLAATPVKVLANKVNITGISVDDESTNKLISDIRRDSHLDVLEPEVHKSTFTNGDGYLFSWPKTDEAGAVIGFDVLLNDPKIVRAVYDPDNPGTLRFVIKSWLVEHEGKKSRRADLYYDKTIERYVTLPDAGENDKKPEKWVQYLDEDQSDSEWLIEHDYGMPWSHFRNALPHGEPEHKPAWGVQNAISKMLITQITTTDRQGWPERYGLVDPEAVLGENNDDPDEEDDNYIDDTDQPVGGKRTNLRSGPGTMEYFTGLKNVGEFSAADPAVFLDPVETYIKLMAQLTDTPLWEFDPSKDQPSGVSRRLAERPLINKANNRKLYLTPEWRRFWLRLLRLSGVEIDDVNISWVPAVTIDDLEGWQILAEKHKAGVPWKVLLVEAGYTPEEAEEWSVMAQPETGTGQQVDTGTGQQTAPQADLDWGLFGVGGGQ